MLQIHGIFNLVATLYETMLLQPKISVWETNWESFVKSLKKEAIMLMLIITLIKDNTF